MYLKPDYKQIMLEWSNEKQREGQWDEEGEQIRRLCNALNSYNGVCAVYFSAGCLEVEYPAISIMPGQGFLWLWLDREVFNRFHRNAFALLQKKPIIIENIEVHYMKSAYVLDREAYIIRIFFQGKPMGAALDESFDAIRTFIYSLEIFRTSFSSFK